MWYKEYKLRNSYGLWAYMPSIVWYRDTWVDIRQMIWIFLLSDIYWVSWANMICNKEFFCILLWGHSWFWAVWVDTDGLNASWYDMNMSNILSSCILIVNYQTLWRNEFWHLLRQKIERILFSVCQLISLTLYNSICSLQVMNISNHAKWRLWILLELKDQDSKHVSRSNYTW
jgi:hypothetical protein